MRRWRQRHPDDHNEDNRAHYARHRERINARSLAYKRANPAVPRVIRENRRARLAQARGRYSAAQWLELVASCEGLCAYCGGPGPLHADHRTPLARGGTNEIGNILPACGVCNMRKHTLTEEEYRYRLSRDLALGRRLLADPRPSHGDGVAGGNNARKLR